MNPGERAQLVQLLQRLAGAIHDLVEHCDAHPASWRFLQTGIPHLARFPLAVIQAVPMALTALAAKALQERD